MGRYRKIETRIWNDEKFMGLSDDGRLVFLFILTHPAMTSLGAFRATMPGLAAELGWDTERLSKAFAEGRRKGMLELYEKACYVGAPKFIKYNTPESPNVVSSWKSVSELIPECPLKVLQIERVRDFLATFGSDKKAFAEAFNKAFPKDYRNPLPNPEPEPEPEQELEQEHKEEEYNTFCAEPFDNGSCTGDENLLPQAPPTKEPPTAKPVTAPSVTSGFDAFWQVYPKKTGKGAARKAWDKIKPNAELQATIMAAVKAQRKTDQWTKEGGQFIPLPATWLNQSRWEDSGVDPEVAKSKEPEDIHEVLDCYRELSLDEYRELRNPDQYWAEIDEMRKGYEETGIITWNGKVFEFADGEEPQWPDESLRPERLRKAQ